MKRNRIYELIDDERDFQNNKWRRGENHWEASPHTKNTVLVEEIGEVSKAILSHDHVNLVEELVQSAAVIVAWLESIDEHVSEQWDNEGCG